MTTKTPTSGSAQRHGPLWGARARDWVLNEERQVLTYEEAIERVGIRPGERVLDVGCGAGVFLSLVADRGAQAFGIDASQELAALASSRVPDADVRVGDMQDLPYDDDSFDLVTGFNSFFFAADMSAALREAGRVAKPGAAVVIQVWGSPGRCDLDAVKDAARAFLEPPPGPPPPALWEAGVLEGIASEAGLRPESAFDTTYAIEYPDQDTLARALLSPGLAVEAILRAGEEPVRAAVLEALAPYRLPSGAYRLENEWRYLVARA